MGGYWEYNINIMELRKSDTHNVVYNTLKIEEEKSGRGGIRTHATEVTGALNQRLRPLGHPTNLSQPCKITLHVREYGRVRGHVAELGCNYLWGRGRRGVSGVVQK